MMRRAAVAFGLAIGISARAALAQEPALPDRIAPATRQAIARVVDSVRTTGVPPGALIDKAAEGVLKGADDARILRAVQSLARELSDARGALGGTTDASILGVGASALHAGVTVEQLRRLAQTSAGHGDVLPTALVTLVDLVAKRVPVSLATTSVQDMLAHRAGERQFTALRAQVEQDILSGQMPDVALRTRARAQLQTLDAMPLDGGAPRRPPAP